MKRPHQRVCSFGSNKESENSRSGCRATTAGRRMEAEGQRDFRGLLRSSG